MTHRLSRTRCCCLVWLCVLLGGSAVASAANQLDRVAYLPVSAADSAASDSNDAWLAASLLQLSGVIQSFDAQQLEIIVDGETQATRIRSERIAWIQPGWDDADAQAGVTAYAAGDWPQSIAGMLAALRRRPPVWRQEWLSALLANAAFEAGRYPAVFELIAQLDRRPLAAPLVGQLPIMWAGRAPDAALVDVAKTKLAAAEPLVRLTAASVLLSSPDAANARRVLQQLAADAQRPLVARLADAQLWRTATPVETKASVDRWLEKIEALPPAVISGPLAAVAERLQAAGESERAVELWLAAGMLAPDPAHPRAARARATAAELLRSLGREQDAERL